MTDYCRCPAADCCDIRVAVPGGTTCQHHRDQWVADQKRRYQAQLRMPPMQFSADTRPPDRCPYCRLPLRPGMTL